MEQRGNFILFKDGKEFASWLLSLTIKRKTITIQNHHTWSPSYKDFNGKNHFERMESMRSFHINDRKFADVAQNLTTFPDGSIGYSLGRGFEKDPAGIYGNNKNAICIEHFGNFDVGGDSMTDEHRKTIVFLNAVLCMKFDLKVDTSSIVYHHWFHPENGKKLLDSDKAWRKSCCGSNFFGGNKIADAEKNFIPLVASEINKIKNVELGDSMKYNPSIIKERVYASNGILKYVPIATESQKKVAYSIPATDIRWLKLEKGKYDLDFIAKKNGKVSQIVKENKADYGINFPFFSGQLPVGTVWDGEKYVNGAYGKMLKWHEFAFKDDTPIIGQLNNLDQYKLSLQGSPPLILNGKMVWKDYIALDEVANDIGFDKKGNPIRRQRTFIGIDKEENLHIFIGDGTNSTVDRGLTIEEMALYAFDKKCIFAIAGDGGGSSIICDQTGGLNQKKNTGVNERTVHHALLIYLKEEVKPVVPKPIETPTRTVQREISVLVDGVKISNGVLIDNLTYVPLRAVGDALNLNVGWNQSTYTASLTKK